MKHTLQELKQWQSLPLEVKVLMTKERIRNWVSEYGEDGVYVSFSGGKDSTVLLHIAREMYGDEIKGVFVNTGLEYPEIVQFVKTFPNIDIIKPKMNFKQVIEKYGYPFISKEVSECVYGARQYLKAVLDKQGAPPPYRYYFEKVTGRGAYSKFSNTLSTADNQAMLGGSRGGYDNKYRKLRGIGEYSQCRQRQGKHIPNSKNVGDAGQAEPIQESDGYP